MKKKIIRLVALIVLGGLSTSCNQLLTSKIPVANNASNKDVMDPTLEDPTEGDASPESTYTPSNDSSLRKKINPPMSVTHKGHCETQ